MSDNLQQVNNIPEPLQKKPSRRVSTIWLVPLAALMISFWLAWQHYSSLGTLITVRFSSAEGLEAKKTPVRFRNVEVGKVEKVQLDKTLTGVVVTIRMEKDTDAYLNDTARFWVELPRIGLGGVSGLGTLFSGAYITMTTTAVEDASIRTAFEGLNEPPLTPDDTPGLRLILTSKTGAAISPGTPVFYKQVEVGRVDSRELRDGQTIHYGVFIEAPYYALINQETKFWELGGFNVDFGAVGGVSFEMAPLPVLLAGGIAFDTPLHLQESDPARPGDTFELFASRSDANFDISASENAFGYVLNFEESLRGLTVGSPVEFRGVQVGYVAEMNIARNNETGKLSVPILIFIEPDRFGAGKDKDALRELLLRSVQKGLRARLQTASYITGQLFVELTIVKDAPARLITAGDPYPEFPTIESQFGAIFDNISTVLKKIESLEIEKLLASANTLLKDVDSLVRSPDDSELGDNPGVKRRALAQAPVAQMISRVNHSLDGLGTILNSDATKKLPEDVSRSIRQLNSSLVLVKRLLEGDSARSPLYYEISTTLKELKRAAQSIRSLTETLDEKPNSLIFGND